MHKIVALILVLVAATNAQWCPLATDVSVGELSGIGVGGSWPHGTCYSEKGCFAVGPASGAVNTMYAFGCVGMPITLGLNSTSTGTLSIMSCTSGSNGTLTIDTTSFDYKVTCFQSSAGTCVSNYYDLFDYDGDTEIAETYSYAKGDTINTCSASKCLVLKNVGADKGLAALTCLGSTLSLSINNGTTALTLDSCPSTPTNGTVTVAGDVYNYQYFCYSPTSGMSSGVGAVASSGFVTMAVFVIGLGARML